MSTERMARGKRTAYAEGVRIYLHDELPVIGSGWRTFTIVKVGRKWVRLQEISTGRGGRLEITMWKKLQPPS